MRETKATSSRPRVTRYSRDLVIELKKVTAALEKASAAADALAGAGVAAPRVTRHARTLAVQVAKADAALKKAKKLAVRVTRSARAVVMKKKVTRYSKDL
jgi:peptide deformylase